MSEGGGASPTTTDLSSSFLPTQFASAAATPSNNIVDLSQQSSSLPNNQGNNQNHYSNVKMKYFQTLGVQQPPQSLPQPISGNSSVVSRIRTKTTPAPAPTNDPVNQIVTQEAIERLRSDSPTKKRSTSMPIPFLHARVSPPAAIPVPNNSGNRRLMHLDEDSDDDIEQFRPPHEMIASSSFQVGTAYDVAVWDRQRRRNLND